MSENVRGRHCCSQPIIQRKQ